MWEGMSDVYELMAGQGLCAYPGRSSPCASFPRRWSSSGAERLFCLTGRSDPRRFGSRARGGKPG